MSEPRLVADGDGGVGVLVPGTLAGRIYTILARAAQEAQRRDGVTLRPDERRLLEELGAAAAKHARGTSAGGSALRDPSSDGSLWLSTTEAATELGCTPRWVTDLANAGELDGMRVGRTWLVSAASVALHQAQRSRSGGSP